MFKGVSYGSESEGGAVIGNSIIHFKYLKYHQFNSPFIFPKMGNAVTRLTHHKSRHVHHEVEVVVPVPPPSDIQEPRKLPPLHLHFPTHHHLNLNLILHNSPLTNTQPSTSTPPRLRTHSPTSTPNKTHPLPRPRRNHRRNRTRHDMRKPHVLGPTESRAASARESAE